MRPEFEPPTTLSERSQRIWQNIVPANARTVGRLTMLRVALECLDHIDQLQAEVSKLPRLTTATLGSATIHVHPLVKQLKETRSQFNQLWTTLGLNHYGEDLQSYSSWAQQQSRG